MIQTQSSITENSRIILRIFETAAMKIVPKFWLRGFIDVLVWTYFIVKELTIGSGYKFYNISYSSSLKKYMQIVNKAIRYRLGKNITWLEHTTSSLVKKIDENEWNNNNSNSYK